MKTKRHYPSETMMKQAVKIYGCNCDACCWLTPAAKRRARYLKAKYAKQPKPRC
jgi:hypothetical protein